MVVGYLSFNVNNRVWSCTTPFSSPQIIDIIKMQRIVFMNHIAILTNFESSLHTLSVAEIRKQKFFVLSKTIYLE